MNVAVVYVFPQVQVQKYFPLAKRFADTWRAFPPGAEAHALYVVGNGGEVPKLSRDLFNGIPCTFASYDNSGWDIGSFQYAAEHIPCDLLVCLGAPVHFHRAGWLDRMVSAFLDHGPALYGCAAYGIPLHVRTTIFWCPPEILRSYPFTIGSTRPMRYDFEHGPHSFTRHVLDSGFPCIMSTWRGDFIYPDWNDHAPDANEILVRDQHIHK